MPSEWRRSRLHQRLGRHCVRNFEGSGDLQDAQGQARLDSFRVEVFFSCGPFPRFVMYELSCIFFFIDFSPPFSTVVVLYTNTHL